MKRKILLVSYGAGHISMIAPLYQQLRADNQTEPHILALSIATNYLDRNNIPYKTLVDFRRLICDRDTERYGELLADRWHVESSGISREESVVYLGASMRDLVHDLGESEAFNRINKLGRQSFLPIWTMEQVIYSEAPDLIVTTNAPRMERASTLVGNKKRIPTINLHDDLGFMRRDYLLTGSMISVMSKVTRNNLIDQGHDKNKIVVNGHPAFDAIPEELKKFESIQIRRLYNISETRPCLLLGTSMIGKRGEIMEITSLVCDAVEKLDSNYQLIIKPHPGEDADAYRKFSNSHPSSPIVVSQANIRELLFISEMLITFKSTIMIEAALMGKPTISVNITEHPNPFPFVDWGLALEVHNEGELLEIIDFVNNCADFKKDFSKARQRHFGDTIDGKACRRVADLIYSLLDH